MYAAILEGPGKFTIQEREVPSIGEDEILVRVKTCGICTSELDMWEGKAKGLEFPRFIGHEPAGIVESVGARVTTVKPGDRVALFADGKGYAEYIAVPESYAYVLKETTSFQHALGEPIACSVNGVRKARPELNDSVCIIGCGFMGLIMLQVFKAAGAGILIAVDTRESMLALARNLGATHTFNPKKHDVKKEVLDITGGRGVDIGVEAAGNQTTLDLTTDIVRMEGKLEVFGFHQGEPRSVNWGYWNWMAFQIINGHTRSPHIYVEGMRLGLAMVESGTLDMEPLVSHSFRLEKINDGFAEASGKNDNFVKGVIVFD
jgi:threonine dehydrogenase-like Zn-dependent dehydrogenase